MSERCNHEPLKREVHLMTKELYVTAKTTLPNGEIKLVVEDTQYGEKHVSLQTFEMDGIKYMAFSFKHESGWYHLKNDGENLKLEFEDLKSPTQHNCFVCSGNLLFEKKDDGDGEGHGLKAEDKRLYLDSGNNLKLSKTDTLTLFRTEEVPKS